MIAAGHGYRAPALVGAGLSTAGVAMLLWSAAAERRATGRAGAPTATRSSVDTRSGS